MPELAARLQTALSDRYRDFRHDRRGAVKVLRPELAAVIGAERFLFDSGEADSFLFYDAVRGGRDPPLPVADELKARTRQ